MTYECLRGSAGTLRKENPVMTGFCLCVMSIHLEFSEGLRNTQFSLVMFQDPTVLVPLIWVLWKRYFAENGDTELAYVQVCISMWINITVVVNLQEAYYHIDVTSGWMCGMLSSPIVAVICERTRSRTSIMVLRTVTKSVYQASCCAKIESHVFW